MDKFRQIIDFTREYLSRLTSTQKMLVGSAVIIMVMAMFLVAQYAGTSNMVAISVDTDQRAVAMNHLRSVGMNFEESAGGILVPSGREQEAISLLSENGALGSDAIDDLITMIQNQPWWQNGNQVQQAMNAARSKVLSNVMSQWSYVNRATVIITSPLQRTMLGQQQPKATASVTVATKSGQSLTPERVESIADFVSGAVVDLLPESVKIIDESTGRSMRPRSKDAFSASNHLELRIETENIIETKIYGLLHYIPGVVVAVNAQLEHKQEQITDRTVKGDGKGSLIAPVSESSQSMQSGNKSSGGEPGVATNTGTQIGGGNSSNQNQSSKQEDKTFETIAGDTVTVTSDTGGQPKKITVAVNIPRSFITRIWEEQNPDETNPPDPAAITALFDSEKPNIENMVRQIIDTSALRNSTESPEDATSGDSVVVNMYHDFGTAIAGSVLAPGVAGSDGGALGFLSSGGFFDVSLKGISMMGLGLISLFMMFRLMRGASVKRKLPTAEELVGLPPALDGDGDQIVGEAAAGEMAMDALELDEADLLAHKMNEQVSEMVTEDPSEAARLVSRWIETDQ